MYTAGTFFEKKKTVWEKEGRKKKEMATTWLVIPNFQERKRGASATAELREPDIFIDENSSLSVSYLFEDFFHISSIKKWEEKDILVDDAQSILIENSSRNEKNFFNYSQLWKMMNYQKGNRLQQNTPPSVPLNMHTSFDIVWKILFFFANIFLKRTFIPFPFWVQIRSLYVCFLPKNKTRSRFVGQESRMNYFWTAALLGISPVWRKEKWKDFAIHTAQR